MKKWLMKLLGVVPYKVYQGTKLKMEFFQSALKQKEEAVEKPIIYAMLDTKVEKVRFFNL